MPRCSIRCSPRSPAPSGARCRRALHAFLTATARESYRPRRGAALRRGPVSARQRVAPCRLGANDPHLARSTCSRRRTRSSTCWSRRSRRRRTAGRPRRARPAPPDPRGMGRPAASWPAASVPMRAEATLFWLTGGRDRERTPPRRSNSCVDSVCILPIVLGLDGLRLTSLPQGLEQVAVRGRRVVGNGRARSGRGERCPHSQLEHAFPFERSRVKLAPRPPSKVKTRGLRRAAEEGSRRST